MSNGHKTNIHLTGLEGKMPEKVLVQHVVQWETMVILLSIMFLYWSPAHRDITNLASSRRGDDWTKSLCSLIKRQVTASPHLSHLHTCRTLLAFYFPEQEPSKDEWIRKMSSSKMQLPLMCMWYKYILLHSRLVGCSSLPLPLSINEYPFILEKTYVHLRWKIP